ncbi:chemotaxis response regulator protein-glutamate methylesterase [Sphingomonas metalli]|uniref:protein-glutamate methylesterase n=1 Tax=Sphingomonas metalli TaxID=1779358 RepID=A0A916T7Q0_9SPHN|nr:chemotaxis protein CheB [Sphingomonas metalli]GGB34827.1 chemotaxis response regulator protein-glutamate methylesterase [Sphingomonas metalli]
MATSPFLPDPGLPLPRVLIVDDSVVARTVIARVIETSGRFVVAGLAGSALAAMQFLTREQVDFILLDLAMPGMDGLSALPELIGLGGKARIVIVSSSTHDGAAETVRALALGAADTIAKPEAGAMTGRFAQALLARLSRLMDGRAPELPPIRRANLPAQAPVAADGTAFDMVAIGASTGGIHALGAMLQNLPAAFVRPILITQHLPPAFVPYFAAQLAAIAGRPCDVAEERMRLRPGRIVIAPGNAHARCVALPDGGAAIRLTDERVPSGCLPSVDPMLASAAMVYGPRVLAVILSGMGRDGAEGARLVREAGGSVVVQDQASSTVWGMPGAVVVAGLADAIMPPAAIGRLMISGRRA